jgi:hypothetical protein
VTGDELKELTLAFASRTLARERWTHSAHLAVGAWHVREYGAAAALERLRHGIRALNEQHGGQNSENSGYHETITAAYVQLLEQFQLRFLPATPIQEVVASLLGSKLADRAVLLCFWTRERLMSPAARASWVAPDLGPLVLSDGMCQFRDPESA